MQVDRQTEVNEDRCTNTDILTNRNKDVQTYTDKQTDRRTVKKYWYRLKNRQMYRKTLIHTYSTYQQYCT
jgi:hypothetical protein